MFLCSFFMFFPYTSHEKNRETLYPKLGYAARCCQISHAMIQSGLAKKLHPEVV